MRKFSRQVAFKRYEERIKNSDNIRLAREVLVQARLCNALTFEDLEKLDWLLADRINSESSNG